MSQLVTHIYYSGKSEGTKNVLKITFGTRAQMGNCLVCFQTKVILHNTSAKHVKKLSILGNSDLTGGMVGEMIKKMQSNIHSKTFIKVFLSEVTANKGSVRCTVCIFRPDETADWH